MAHSKQQGKVGKTKANVLVRVLGRNPQGRSWKDLIMGSELFASDLVNCFALIIVRFLSRTDQSPVFVLMSSLLTSFGTAMCLLAL